MCIRDSPHPSPHYYGTGECFLWRSTLLSSSLSLPPPPSTDTTHLHRSTTLAAPTTSTPTPSHADLLLSPDSASSTTPNNSHSAGTSTPDRIRFKAFPYSGVNDYVLYCEPSYLSVGGGDGRYGLWLDGVLERGVSGPCLTFGNEGLSEEGGKFEVLGVEIWCIGV